MGTDEGETPIPFIRVFSLKPPISFFFFLIFFFLLPFQTVKDHLPLPGKPPRKRVLDENEVALPNIEEDVEDVDNDFMYNEDDDDWEEDIRFDQRDEQSY